MFWKFFERSFLINFKIPAKTTDYSLRIGTVMVVNLTINSGQCEQQFLAYISKCERTPGIVYFEMIASFAHIDRLKRGSKVCIIAKCNVYSLIEMHNKIDTALECNMLQGIVNPSIFGRIDKVSLFFSFWVHEKKYNISFEHLFPFKGWWHFKNTSLWCVKSIQSWRRFYGIGQWKSRWEEKEFLKNFPNSLFKKKSQCDLIISFKTLGRANWFIWLRHWKNRKSTAIMKTFQFLLLGYQWIHWHQNWEDKKFMKTNILSVNIYCSNSHFPVLERIFFKNWNYLNFIYKNVVFSLSRCKL